MSYGFSYAKLSSLQVEHFYSYFFDFLKSLDSFTAADTPDHVVYTFLRRFSSLLEKCEKKSQHSLLSHLLRITLHEKFHQQYSCMVIELLGTCVLEHLSNFDPILLQKQQLQQKPHIVHQVIEILYTIMKTTIAEEPQKIAKTPLPLNEEEEAQQKVLQNRYKIAAIKAIVEIQKEMNDVQQVELNKIVQLCYDMALELKSTTSEENNHQLLLFSIFLVSQSCNVKQFDLQNELFMIPFSNSVTTFLDDFFNLFPACIERMDMVLNMVE